MRLITIFLRKRCWPLMFVLTFIVQTTKLCCGSENENFESKYQTAVDLVLHDKSNRDFRRGLSILEELSLGIGRTSADALAELAAIYLIGNRLGYIIWSTFFLRLSSSCFLSRLLISIMSLLARLSIHSIILLLS